MSDTPDESHRGAPDAELAEPVDLAEPADPAEFVLPPADPARAPNGRADRRSGRPSWVIPAIACVVLVPILVMLVVIGRNRSDTTASSTGPTSDQAGDDTTDSSTSDAVAVDASDTSLAPLEPYDGWVNPASVGGPYSDKVDGLLSFRGNPTRTYYGKGPVPTAPTGALDVPGREQRRALLAVLRRAGHAHVVRQRLDRPAQRVGEGRQDLGGLRRLRPRRALPRCRERHPTAARLQGGRHHQGHGHASTPTASRSSTPEPGTTSTGPSPSTSRPRQSSGSCGPTTPSRSCGTTTGTDLD